MDDLLRSVAECGRERATPQPAPAPFIVGVGRSGTTLLRLMLDSHPELAVPGETHFLSELFGTQRSEIDAEGLFRLVTEAVTWPNFGLDAAIFRQLLGQLEPFSVTEGIRLFYQLYAQQHSKARWGDKTPTYRSGIVEIANLLPEAHFIHVIRDGRDVAMSYRGLWFGPGDSITAQAEFWRDQVLLARRQAAAVSHYMEVRFEELVNDPEGTLRTVCGFIGLTFDSGMLEYHRFADARLGEMVQPFGPAGQKPPCRDRFLAIHVNTKRPPDRSRISRWRTEMSDQQLGQYEEIAGPLLCELGYPTGSRAAR